MTTVDGGLRARLIRDSLEELLRASLQARGWFDPGRRHLPIQFVSAPNNWDEPIDLNSLTISDGGSSDSPLELGTNATEDTWTYYVDFYAEDESIGLDMGGELRDVLRGKLPSIGRTEPTLSVYDYRQATPPLLFVCQLDNVVVDRAHGFSQAWRQWWFSIRADVVDEYD